MTRVLVTDGDERAALAVVRSLGRAGCSVHVCGARRRTLAALSRRAVAGVATPDPLRAPGRFADTVASYVAAHGIDVVLPIAEPALLAILGAREQFGDAIIPFPDLDTVRAINDKRALRSVAEGIGIAFPPQWELGAAADLDRLGVDALPFPVVLKPSRSVGEEDGQRSKQTVRHARGAAELRERVARLPRAAFPLLIQQRLVGPGRGVFLLRWDGKTIASFSHERLREKPPSGGVSVYSEAVTPDGALIARSERLLDAFAWNGVAMIEYKIDAASGTPYLMEINGRFWGSLQLAIDAGVDFPALLLDCALGRVPATPAPAPPTGGAPYRTGTRSRWWWGEVDHVLARLRRSDAELALPPGAPSRAATLAQFFARWRADERDAVFRLADPLPFLYESVQWLRRR